MPYSSDAQRKYFNANREELEAQGVDVDEWNKSTKGKKLPEKVKKKDSGQEKVSFLGFGGPKPPKDVRGYGSTESGRKTDLVNFTPEHEWEIESPTQGKMYVTLAKSNNAPGVRVYALRNVPFEQDGEILSRVVLTDLDDAFSSPSAELTSLVTEPKHRRKGYASTVLQAMEQIDPANILVVEPDPMADKSVSKEVLEDFYNSMGYSRLRHVDPSSPMFKVLGKEWNDSSKKANEANFLPDYTPDQLREMGVYKEVYGPKDAPRLASLPEWPAHWYNEADPHGWLQWYDRYSKGRRIEDDKRQIKRWLAFKARHGGKAFQENPTPRRAYALRNWGIDPTKLVKDPEALKTLMDEYREKQYSKKMEKVSFLPKVAAPSAPPTLDEINAHFVPFRDLLKENSVHYKEYKPRKKIVKDVPLTSKYREVVDAAKQQKINVIKRHLLALTSRPAVWSGTNAFFFPDGERGIVIAPSEIGKDVLDHEYGHAEDYARLGGKDGFKKEYYPGFFESLRMTPREYYNRMYLLPEARAWHYAGKPVDLSSDNKIKNRAFGSYVSAVDQLTYGE